MQNTAEDISNAASGHKANLSNPNTSEGSKAHSKEILESMPDQPHYGKEEQNVSKNPNQVAGGLKATIANDTIPESTKQEAKEKLNNM
ncbi:MAG: hypothetical protein L6R41_006799 [Letrouitia leprolyta]|nr:MAG: hypothetical protein L6R41_006799 [Letrouitia leprolyta]